MLLKELTYRFGCMLSTSPKGPPMSAIWGAQRYTEIIHDPLIFIVLRKEYFYCHRETLTQYITFKRGVCTLVLCSLATVMSCIDASVQVVKISEGGTSTYILPSLWRGHSGLVGKPWMKYIILKNMSWKGVEVKVLFTSQLVYSWI